MFSNHLSVTLKCKVCLNNKLRNEKNIIITNLNQHKYFTLTV